jgi:hypothetical protein
MKIPWWCGFEEWAVDCPISLMQHSMLRCKITGLLLKTADLFFQSAIKYITPPDHHRRSSIKTVISRELYCRFAKASSAI